jgi:hypothetical protein
MKFARAFLVTLAANVQIATALRVCTSANHCAKATIIDDVTCAESDVCWLATITGDVTCSKAHSCWLTTITGDATCAVRDSCFRATITGCCSGDFCPTGTTKCPTDPTPAPSTASAASTASCTVSVHGDDVYKCSAAVCVKNTKADRSTWAVAATASAQAVPAGESFTTTDAEWTVSNDGEVSVAPKEQGKASFSFPCECTCNAN